MRRQQRTCQGWYVLSCEGRRRAERQGDDGELGGGVLRGK